MAQVIDAIYENGVLRPIQPLKGVSDRERVTVSISTSQNRSEASAGTILDCFGIMADEDADELRKIIEDEFERVDLDGWK
jgi:predicted DNA-binding antitoxin AbrB/MazE fold protein